MLPGFLRTLSARILVGFAVLILTFGVTTAWIVAYMHEVGIEIEVIRTGYLRLALTTKDLARKQDDLRSYLSDDLVGESNTKRVEARVNGFRASRDRMIHGAREIVLELRDMPERHARRLAETSRHLDDLEAAIGALKDAYARLLAAPPIEAGATPAAESATKALAELKTAERQIAAKSAELALHQERMVTSTARNLEYNEGRLRTYTIYLGVLAVLVGMMVTLWAVMTFRPLGRLREAARRIAAGDYGSRIKDEGPTEVAELAREFNAIGSAVEERQRELVRTERLAAVGKMAAMIAHEVRNPLSSVGLNTELLEEELGSMKGAEEARALCRSISKEVDRLTAITDEYLTLARLPKPRLAAEQLNTIVSSVASFVEEDLRGRGVALDVVLADGLPRTMADEGQVRQALLNLIRNGAEAIGPDGGGRLTLSTRRGSAGMVEVEVKDDGPGIPAETQERVFDPFFSTKENGTGLGLALTREIARDHGGDIVVTSKPGSGASFVMSLPVASAG